MRLTGCRICRKESKKVKRDRHLSRHGRRNELDVTTTFPVVYFSVAGHYDGILESWTTPTTDALKGLGRRPEKRGTFLATRDSVVDFAGSRLFLCANDKW